VGKPEKLILETMRIADAHSGVWDASKLTSFVYPPRDHGLRQVYRIIDRLHVIPPALSLDRLLEKTPLSHRRLIEASIDKARSQRLQISIVQLKEVRMGTWALLWNNLRLAKNWIWVTKDEYSQDRLNEAALRMIRSHRRPCCLIFDASAKSIYQSLASHRQHLMREAHERTIILEGFESSYSRIA